MVRAINRPGMCGDGNTLNLKVASGGSKQWIQHLTVLTPIWTLKPETARRVRRLIRATLKWCQAHGFAQFNAAGDQRSAVNATIGGSAMKSSQNELPAWDGCNETATHRNIRNPARSKASA